MDDCSDEDRPCHEREIEFHDAGKDAEDTHHCDSRYRMLWIIVAGKYQRSMPDAPDQADHECCLQETLSPEGGDHIVAPPVFLSESEEGIDGAAGKDAGKDGAQQQHRSRQGLELCAD